MKFALPLIVACSILLQGPPSAMADKKADAQRFFRAGEQAFESSQYQMAAQAFEQAYERLPLPAIAFSMAQSYRLQYFVDKDPRWLKRAVEMYRVYIEKQTSGGRRADAVANLAELEPILQRIEVQGQVDGAVAERQTKLLVTSQTVGARASIAGGKLAKLPLAQEVAAGKYRIRVEANGYFPFDDEREVFEGQFRVVEIKLKPKPAVIELSAESNARVSVDGRTVGFTPLTRPLEIPAGRHLLSVTRRGRNAFSKEVVAERGQTVKVSADLKTSTQRQASYWVMGSGAALFLIAGGTALTALGADRDAKTILNRSEENGGLSLVDLADYEAARDRRGDLLTATYAVLGVAAAVSTAGVLLYFMDTPQSASREGISLVPVVGAESQGFAVSGRF